MSHDVFISYSSKDKVTADAACATLEAKGIGCWIAPRDIRPGNDWGEAIVDAINGARVFVLVFSNNANVSPQIKREVERAINKGIPVIPLRIENVMPAKSLEYFLSTPHWLDAFSPPLEKHLDYLAAVSRSILDGKPAPAPSAPGAATGAGIERRYVIGGGIGIAALALAFFLVPQETPSFTGKWEAERFDIAPGAPSPFGAFSVNSFYNAALAGKKLSGHFEVDPVGAYKFSWGGDDTGTVTLESPGRARFVSDLTQKATVLAYVLLDATQAAAAVGVLGGESGDGAIALSSPGSTQAILPGTPQGAGPAGHWSTHTPAAGLIPATKTALDITPDGHYRFHFEFLDSGLFQAADGKWTRTPPGQPPVTGTFKFDGKDRVTTAGSGGVTSWVRTD